MSGNSRISLKTLVFSKPQQHVTSTLIASGNRKRKEKPFFKEN
jgi:hypothetical protein